MGGEQGGSAARLAGVRATKLLRFVPEAPIEAPLEGTTTVVLDTTWTAHPDDPVAGRCVGLRDVAERVMTARDLFAEGAALLDGWAESSGVIDAFVIDGTSFWYGERLRYWMWLVDQILWLAIVEDLLGSVAPARIECAPGTDGALVDAARAIAGRDGLAFVAAAEASEPPAPEPAIPDAPPALSAAETAGPASAQAAPGRRSIIGRIRRRWFPEEPIKRRREVLRRLERIERDRRRPLLVVQAHARQRIETATGPRFINAYLGPVVERLARTRLEPVEVDIRAEVDDDRTWRRIRGRKARRQLPIDALVLAGPRVRMGPAREEATAVAERIAAIATPLVVSGVDLGPVLASRIASKTRSRFSRSIVEVARIRQLLARLRPAGILLADEYHRQDWLSAAAAEGIPTAAIQHGVIYRWHTGYVHRSRPATLRLPDRTYVFGSWERDLLTSHSVYRPDEVRVGGSPRLDLVQPGDADRAAVRRELGVRDGDRLVVLSGTWGPLYRRFHYPIALAHLFCRPIPRLHVVVKLHPSEQDDGPYRPVINGLAAAGGFEPPPVTTVQAIDLYRLLGAADAHLGIHSTVLTEAAAVGTPNLLADVLAASDLLGYVEAGAAHPVRTPEDIAAALDRPRRTEGSDPGREAFLQAHFEPGSASERIAADLLAWLA